LFFLAREKKGGYRHKAEEAISERESGVFDRDVGSAGQVVLRWWKKRSDRCRRQGDLRPRERADAEGADEEEEEAEVLGD